MAARVLLLTLMPKEGAAAASFSAPLSAPVSKATAPARPRGLGSGHWLLQSPRDGTEDRKWVVSLATTAQGSTQPFGGGL